MKFVFTFLLSFFWITQSGSAAPTADQLMGRLDELYRFDSSTAKLTMTITTPNWIRSLKLESWSLGQKKMFIRILSPARDAGVTTLRVDKNMWNFFPKIDKVIQVPPSMMMGSWMGSDFTNDDLVRETSYKDEYDATVSEEAGLLKLTTTPKPNVATVWGKVVTTFDPKNLIPLGQDFFDENGQLVRTMSFSDLKNFDGKMLPSKMTLVPKEKVGHKTEVLYEELKFTKVSEDVFTLKNLRTTR